MAEEKKGTPCDVGTFPSWHQHVRPSISEIDIYLQYYYGISSTVRGIC